VIGVSFSRSSSTHVPEGKFRSLRSNYCQIGPINSAGRDEVRDKRPSGASKVIIFGMPIDKEPPVGSVRNWPRLDVKVSAAVEIDTKIAATVE
jgi:hypothetical protein